MIANLSRRSIIQAAGALAVPLGAAPIPGPRAEGPTTPKICLESGAGSLSAGGQDPEGMRRIKQLGVDHVLIGGPRIPWEEGQVRSIMKNFKSGGLFLGNMMIAAHHAALEQAPEAFNRVCVDDASHVLASVVIDGFVWQRKHATA